MTKRFLSAVLLTLAVCPFNAAEIFTGYDINAIVAKMSLEQKARLLVGSEGKNDGLSHIVPGAAGWTYEIPALGIGRRACGCTHKSCAVARRKN